MARDFTVDHTALDASSKGLDQAANDLEVVKGGLQSPPEFSADHYGDGPPSTASTPT
ncbi:hypothetical protein P3T39_007269 [Kitasatospora sp. GP82]|nr:hypothetical protein [Kitasatospora sp. GP82]